jgi:hypothetical protein
MAHRRLSKANSGQERWGTSQFLSGWQLSRHSFGYSNVAVPLTPALSPRRGSIVPTVQKELRNCWRFAALTNHPLPKGEGWGEGEGIARIPKRLKIEMHPWRFASDLKVVELSASIRANELFPPQRPALAPGVRVKWPGAFADVENQKGVLCNKEVFSNLDFCCSQVWD